MHDPSHEIYPDVVRKCISQLNTVELDVATDKYANATNHADPITAMYGTPNRLRRLNTGGAWPSSASE